MIDVEATNTIRLALVTGPLSLDSCKITTCSRISALSLASFLRRGSRTSESPDLKPNSISFTHCGDS
jgi:hypothetical protein